MKRQAVKTLAAILALAEGLDRSHAAVVDDVEFIEDPDQAVATIRVTARNDAELELWAAQRHIAPLASLLGCPLTIERVARHAPAVAAATPRASSGGRGRAKGRPRTTARRLRARQTSA